ncbi:MAG: 2-oxo acid dehydrogenase subunit E2 [Nanoarchaeota archaeon]|nr:2-oxo acid dehydrogenase subunit E2 [Nanoarchaeota archaeon]
MNTKKMKYAPVPVTSISIQIVSAQIHELIRSLSTKGLLVSFGDIVFYAVCQGLGKFPIFNSFYEDHVKIYPQINVGYSINLDNNPKVAVVKDADKKNVLEISQEIKKLSLKYIHGELTDAESEESTFLINNLSSFNAFIINTPIYERRSAMLSIASEYDSLKIISNQAIPTKKFNLTLSFDPRVADCQQALSFLNSVREILESHDHHQKILS